VEEQSKSPEAQGAENRKHIRYSVDEDSVVLFLSHGGPAPGRVLDLSQEGCRVRTGNRTSMQPGWPIEISFTVRGVSFRFRGVIQWTSGGNLVGIRFEHAIPRRLAELAEVISEMEEAAAAKAKAANKPASEQKTPELTKTTRAASERQNIQLRASGTGILPEQNQPGAPSHNSADPQSVSPGVAGNRRRNLRQAVDTSALIFLVRTGSRLEGRILDLSLGGCRIRTDERFPVGIYTRVETEFRLKGLPFRLGGVVQAIHDRNNVGIRFIDLSDRKRQQVVELMGEIEEMRAAPDSSEASPIDNRSSAD